MHFVLPKFQLSEPGRKIDLAEPGNYLLKWLISTLVETNIFRPEYSMLPGWGKFSTSSRSMLFLLKKIQHSGLRIENYIAEFGRVPLE
jgi:hypothetical protein